MFQDPFNRNFKKLRVSLTGDCNFACAYCVPSDTKLIKNHEPRATNTNSIYKLSSPIDVQETIFAIQSLHNILKLETIHLTGGEPLLYFQLDTLLGAIQHLNIVIKLTTNGFLLSQKAVLLKEHNVKHINVSLDAVDQELFLPYTKAVFT
ncbi:MAG: radical SAM protein [Bacteroidales bacterium]|nr:radical SAM protein [Bacteroidales bacterium]